MKKLFIIGGTMGTGKTATCRILKNMLDKSVFLDGDWCWDMHPFTVNEATKAMVTDNICHVLNNFISCNEFENIIFCWVMHEQSIIDGLLARLNTSGLSVKLVSLICGENALISRLQSDIKCGLRESDIIERSIQRLPMYNKLNTVKIDVSNISALEAAKMIAKL